MVGLPLRHLPQQLQRQRVEGKAKAAKAKPPDPHPADEAARKAVKVETRLGLQVALVPLAMNGRKPVNAHAPVASMPTHMAVGRALAVAGNCPAGEERGAGTHLHPIQWTRRQERR